VIRSNVCVSISKTSTCRNPVSFLRVATAMRFPSWKAAGVKQCNPGGVTRIGECEFSDTDRSSESVKLTQKILHHPSSAILWKKIVESPDHVGQPPRSLTVTRFPGSASGKTTISVWSSRKSLVCHRRDR